MTRYRIIYSDGIPGLPLTWPATLRLVQTAVAAYRAGRIRFRPVRVEKVG